MTTHATDHDYDPVTCQRLPRHTHAYQAPRGVANRCPQGHRGRFQVKLGGPIPLTVGCTTCAQQNRTATAYERGRADALAKPAADHR